MHNILKLLFLFLITPLLLPAQLFPREGSKLNYRLIGFSFPSVNGAAGYTIQVATGNQTTEDAFRKNIIRTFKTTKNKLIAEVPTFGTDYTWRAISGKGSPATGPLHHFTTGMPRAVNDTITRLNVFKNTGKYKDTYIFCDATAALYDMKGHPVWYIPGKDSLAQFIDIKPTAKGTITFLSDKKDKSIVEINYNGDTLWIGPNNGKISGDAIEYYNHEFTRLGNDHYMVLSEEKIQWAHMPGEKNKNTDAGSYPNPNTPVVTKPPLRKTDSRTPFGTVLEYDRQGNVVWSWHSFDYFKQCDTNDLDAAYIHYAAVNNDQKIMDVHINSFYFDEKEKMLYVSFRNIGTIFKVKYPEGTVVNTYGMLDISHNPATASKWFCGQHSCKVSQNGYLYLFNNNYCNNGAPPQLLMIKQPVSGKEAPEKIWEYTCTNDDMIALKLNETKDPRYGNGVKLNSPIPATISFDRGGNVIELPDKSMFVDVCGNFGRIFIVTRDKKIVWEATIETWTNELKKWNTVANYRASIIDRKDLETLIWNSEK